MVLVGMFCTCVSVRVVCDMSIYVHIYMCVRIYLCIHSQCLHYVYVWHLSHLAFPFIAGHIVQIVAEQYRDFPTFDLFYRGALAASTEGELCITLPDTVRIAEEKSAERDKDPEDEPVKEAAGGLAPSLQFKTMVIRVYYEVSIGQMLELARDEVRTDV